MTTKRYRHSRANLHQRLQEVCDQLFDFFTVERLTNTSVTIVAALSAAELHCNIGNILDDLVAQPQASYGGHLGSTGRLPAPNPPTRAKNRRTKR